VVESSRREGAFVESDEESKTLPPPEEVAARVGLPQLVAKAKATCREYLTTKEDAYRQREKWRTQHGVPVIALCGHGRAGKDLSAKYLAHRTIMEYGGSTSSAVAPLIAAALDRPLDEVFAERHAHRMFWFEFCNELRASDPTLLARMNLSEGDMVVGLRSELEIHAVMRERVAHYSVWIANPRVPVDPTVEYGPEDCDFSVVNGGARLQLFSRWDTLLGLMTRPHFTDAK
jgi:hypothetical protein